MLILSDPIKPIAINNNVLLLELPNQFFYEWIQSHYKKVIEQTATGVTKTSLKIKFTVSPEARSIKYDQTEEPPSPPISSIKNPEKPKSLNEQYTLLSFIQGTHN